MTHVHVCRWAASDGCELHTRPAVIYSKPALTHTYTELHYINGRCPTALYVSPIPSCRLNESIVPNSTTIIITWTRHRSSYMFLLTPAGEAAAAVEAPVSLKSTALWERYVRYMSSHLVGMALERNQNIVDKRFFRGIYRMGNMFKWLKTIVVTRFISMIFQS